jgi:hypothetical protein
MRIDIVREITPLEREQYEFNVRLVSKGIYIEFVRYTVSTRVSPRHRVYKIVLIWSRNNYGVQYYPTNMRVDRPVVPHSINERVIKQLKTSTHVDYDILPA